MSTPTRRTKRNFNVYAPYKSPLKVINENRVLDDISNGQSNKVNSNVDDINSQLTMKNADRQINRQNREQLDEENIPVDSVCDINVDSDADIEIENCINKLLSKRPNQKFIDLEIELFQWHNRLHAYNEAKMLVLYCSVY
ncbi:unnamed protein product [Heterobilharzia americana]|nr:unnamed protein product [Heterobilharzia americana]